MLRRLDVTCAVIALAAAFAACDGEDRDALETGASLPDSASGDVTQYALMRNSIGWLTDSNIVALASQMNEAVVAIPRLQVQTWASQPLNQLALEIIRDHERMQFSIDSVATLKRIPSQAPAIAPALQAPYDSLLSTQVGLPLREREALLIDMVIAVHARSTVDFGALAGNAQDPDLRAVLANRGVLMEQTHLARARLIDAAMTRADSAKQDSARTSRGDRRR